MAACMACASQPRANAPGGSSGRDDNSARRVNDSRDSALRTDAVFNPNPRIQVLPISAHDACYVIDDALLEPDAWVEYASSRAEAFADASFNAYPGGELRLPDAAAAPLDRFFSTHLRRAFGVRRTLRMYARLAMVTRPPHALRPWQTIPHRDRLGGDASERVVASVLYLFRDERLGGTHFFAPRRGADDIATLLRDANALSPGDFSARHGLAQAYANESSDWFERVLTVPARWNRLIVYRGDRFHSGQIADPARLDADPRRGRLTLNGFWTCRRALDAG